MQLGKLFTEHGEAEDLAARVKEVKLYKRSHREINHKTQSPFELKDGLKEDVLAFYAKALNPDGFSNSTGLMADVKRLYAKHASTFAKRCSTALPGGGRKKQKRADYRELMECLFKPDFSDELRAPYLSAAKANGIMAALGSEHDAIPGARATDRKARAAEIGKVFNELHPPKEGASASGNDAAESGDSE